MLGTSNWQFDPMLMPVQSSIACPTERFVMPSVVSSITTLTLSEAAPFALALAIVAQVES